MQSAGYTIAHAIAAQLRALAGQLSVGFVEDPALPIDPPPGTSRLLFLIRRGDKLVDGTGQRDEKRRVRVVVGVVALTEDPMAAADALLFAARDRIRSETTRQAVRDANGTRGMLPREVEIEPDLQDIAARGTLLLSAYEIDYLQSYPNAA